jgi:fermentation-respiration switch protein FrsA (DUF1100 family)
MDLRPFLLPVAVLAAAWLALVLYAWLMQRSLIYLPERVAPDPTLIPAGAEEVQFATDDGLTLTGWFLPADRPSDSPGPAVIVFNGNAGHRGYRTPLAEALAAQGLHVLLFDYRGYGGNPGSPTEDGLRRDARAATMLLAARREVDPDRIVYFGESLGAGVAVALAVERQPAGLVLRSPFTSLASMGRRHYPYLPMWDPLLWDRFAAVDQIGQVEAPILVVAGAEDVIVPPDESRALFDAARNPKRWVQIERAGHNDAALLDGQEMLRAIADFLRESGVLPQR